MNNDINLITQKEQRPAYSKVFLASSILFGTIFMLALIITLYSFSLKAKAGSLSEDVSRARNRVANYALRKQKILVVTERIDSARSIISKRNNLERRASQILAAIPDSFSIDTMKAGDDVITVRLGSSSLLAFDDLLETRLISLARDKDLGLKKIESPSFIKSGNYELTLSFYFSETAKK